MQKWGLDWISLHAECESKFSSSQFILRLTMHFLAAQRIGKPVILEEFGMLGLGRWKLIFIVKVSQLFQIFKKITRLQSIQNG